ncbi:COX15/CtaA family protein [Ferdinandcohnia quinoae]|uniref:COX15/CtaA family protein n=1 Tax=Fredinandcohnia quinoae TaxID=2918902 RepID=A0AAW5E7D1_9BACI|nr:COX15/CtaA family protein [Fredinandcohnia sp. SECRCQ15]MCH1626824.1 COX15/CtaA family protein [Fredinandcohnia sp. SECRCQ15]
MKIKLFSLLTIFVTYILIVFGGYVASSESGMGCGPDWPLCNGVVIPILQGATLVEFAHRVIGAILFILTCILLWMIIRSRRRENGVRIAAYWMIFLLVIQVILGAIVVILDLPAIVVTIHLLIAMAFLACLIWIHHSQRVSVLQLKKRSLLLSHLYGVTILLVLTLAFGAYIKHQSYGLACSWLDCRDSLLPVTSAQILQTIHRTLAIVSAIYILLLTYISFRKNWGSSIQKRLMLATITVVVQVLIGIFTVTSNISVSWAVLHLAAGTALFGIIIEALVSLHFAVSRIKIPDWSRQIGNKI